VPVCTTATCPAPAVAETEAVVVGLGGTEDDGLGDGLVAAAVGVGVELGLVVVVDLLLHAERRAIVAARATRPNRCMFIESPHRPSAVRLGEGSIESQIRSLIGSCRRSRRQRKTQCWEAAASGPIIEPEHVETMNNGAQIYVERLPLPPYRAKGSGRRASFPALLASIGGNRSGIECRPTKRRHGPPGDPATIRRSVRARARATDLALQRHQPVT
jgi:hypothetical protein